MIKTEAED